MRRYLSTIKWLVKNTILYIKFNRKYSKSNYSNKILYLDLRENPYHRYLAILLLFFKIQGYKIKIRFNIFFWGCWSTSLLIKLGIPFTLSVLKPSKYLIGLTDHLAQDNELVLLNKDYFSNELNPDYHIPMCMVDTMYVKGYYLKSFNKNSDKQRRIKIFFAGRFGDINYLNNILQDKFSIIPRQQLLKLTLKAVGTISFTPQRETDLFNEKEFDVVLVDRDIYNIPAEKLRDILAQCDFFIAFPGVVMPYCHNIIEAMSAGCIPITQYAHLMHPPLETDKNCLGFTSEIDYKEMLYKALTLSNDQKKIMRKEVFKYYKNYLTPEAVISKVEKLKTQPGLIRIMLNAEYESVKIKK